MLSHLLGFHVRSVKRPGYHETIKTLFTPSSTSKSEGLSTALCSHAVHVAASLRTCKGVID